MKELFTYTDEELEKKALEYLNKFKDKMKVVSDEILSSLYSDIIPHIKSDAWANYREDMRMEIEHEYIHSKFRNTHAIELRKTIFKENREEISKLIEKDIIHQIQVLEDQVKGFAPSRYTERGEK